MRSIWVTTAVGLLVLFTGFPGTLRADAGDATIYEIQQGVYSQFTWVTVDSTVVTAVAPNGFWIEEPAGGAYSGIYVNRGDTPPVNRHQRHVGVRRRD